MLSALKNMALHSVKWHISALKINACQKSALKNNARQESALKNNAHQNLRDHFGVSWRKHPFLLDFAVNFFTRVIFALKWSLLILKPSWQYKIKFWDSFGPLIVPFIVEISAHIPMTDHRCDNFLLMIWINNYTWHSLEVSWSGFILSGFPIWFCILDNLKYHSRQLIYGLVLIEESKITLQSHLGLTFAFWPWDLQVNSTLCPSCPDVTQASAAFQIPSRISLHSGNGMQDFLSQNV